MRPRFPRRPWAHAAVVAIAMLACWSSWVPARTRRRRRSGPPPKVQETVGDLVVRGQPRRVEGRRRRSGPGLDNTGADAPPSWYRKQLVDEMSKAGVEHAEKLLASPQVSMVIVQLTIPIGVTPTDRLDVQVEVPPAAAPPAWPAAT